MHGGNHGFNAHRRLYSKKRCLAKPGKLVSSCSSSETFGDTIGTLESCTFFDSP